MAGIAHLKKASLVGAFFMASVFCSLAQAFCPAPAQVAPVQVQRVVDGDTLRLRDGRSVRLIGLNAPELARKERPAEPFANAARKRLQALVEASDGRVGLLLGRQAKDHYGRTLAHLYDARGANLEAQLLAEGLAVRVAIAPNTLLDDCLRNAEAQAREQRLGLWARPPLVQAEQVRAGGFAIVTGTVREVARNRGGLWLEMPGSLVLRVAPEALADFDERALRRLAGARVEARGWVIDRSRRGGVKPGQARWMLPLTHSTMLEVLP
ncbi:nuclease homologue [Pseudomonas cuatrocienegasensis]|uniref:Nuclease homologue n=1 Tax=Pseudomonas cuatrocienegasensis TaxID=543360 RepID=A0ABY1B601_9PSED|nr:MULTISPECIES: thermonuclease family protein [Pseudomonas]SEQ02986.1 nuclease homologue [Pseudomonas cuatrocienegasensis]